jgi:hypothetical protein
MADEFHFIAADQVSGSVAEELAWAVPIATVPSGPDTLQVMEPAPSPVRTDAVRTTVPLTDPSAGSMSRTTGVLVAGAHAIVIDCVCCTGTAVGITGTTLYV